MLSRIRPVAVLAASLIAGLATSTSAFAQINSYGSGLYSSETLSTPPDQRHGGYWDSTSQNQHRQDGLAPTRRTPSAAPATSQSAGPR